MNALSSSTPEPVARPVFPFTALVGQPRLRQALLLAAIDPGVGGVLITGPRGTAKSTAARALAALLPGAPFVTLPLGASLEQLVGTLDVEDVLRDGRLRLKPGLLARAHGGVLYVDEVNLLPDTLIDSLLDAAASGLHTVERDGISQQHPSRFVLVGTMNPEEGELRPQLLDRFGLAVALCNPADPGERMAILRARLAFDTDPAAVAQSHAEEMRHLVETVVAARAALPRMTWPDEVLRHAAERCHAAGVDGLRADLVMLRAARALAALKGHDTVQTSDVDAVAPLTLAHRAGGGQSGTGSIEAASSTPGSDPPSTQASEPLHGGQAVAAASPAGTWGELPPQPADMACVRALGAWPPKA